MGLIYSTITVNLQQSDNETEVPEILFSVLWWQPKAGVWRRFPRVVAYRDASLAATLPWSVRDKGQHATVGGLVIKNKKILKKI